MPMPQLPSLSLPLLARAAQRRRRRGQVPEMTEEEQRGILGQLMGGLEWLALSYDKPGAAVRGTLVGQPGAWKHAIPFSSTYGGVDPHDRVWGRDVLTHFGLAPPNRPGMAVYKEDPAELAYDLAGFATEIALDPFTMLTGPGRALTKSGQVASRGAREVSEAMTTAAARTHFGKAVAGKLKTNRLLGTTPWAKIKEIEAGERAFMGIGLPFPFNIAKPQSLVQTNLGMSKRAASRAYAGAIYGKYSPIRGLRALFAHQLEGARRPMAQMMKDASYSEIANISAAFRDVAPAFTRRLDDLGKVYGELTKHAQVAADGHAVKSFGEFARYISTQKQTYANGLPLQAQQIQALFNGGSPPEIAQFSNQFFSYLDDLRAIKDIPYQRVRELGLPASMLDDMFEGHMTRHRVGNPVAQQQLDDIIKRRMLEPGLPEASGRASPLRDAFGTRTINLMSTDPLLTATKGQGDAIRGGIRAWLQGQGVDLPAKISLRDAQKLYVRHRYANTIAARMELPEEIFESMFAGATKPAREAARGQARAATAASTAGRPMPAGLEDITEEGIHALRAHGKVDDLLDYLKNLPEQVRETGLFSRSIIDDWFDYMEHTAVTEGNLRTIHSFLRGVMSSADDATGTPLRDVWKTASFGRGKAGLTDTGLERLVTDWATEGGKSVDDLGALINKIRVPEKTVNALQTYLDVMKPQSSGMLGNFYDTYTAAAKAGWTLPWPAFHARNWLDGQWRAWASAGDGSYPMLGKNGYMRAFGDAKRYLSGKGALPYADEIRHARMLEDARMLDIYSPELGRGVGALPTSHTAWMEPFTPKWFRKWGKKALDPRRTRGIQQHTTLAATTETGEKIPSWFLMEAGERAYNYVEFSNRIPSYIALRRSGFSPSQAREWVMRVQFNYAQASPFSKNVARKVFPFWGFMSHNIPYQMSNLLNSPGGRHAQTLRLINLLQREGGGYLPGWLRERTGMRISPEGDESQVTVARQLGLSQEDLSNIVMQKGSVVPSGRTLERYLSQTNPLISTSYKLFGQRDPYTGRELRHMEPLRLGEKSDEWFKAHPNVSTAIMASPLSRIATSQRMLTDPRKHWFVKGVDFLSGVKFGTYDLEKWRLIEAQQAMEAIAEEYPGVRKYETLYVPPEEYGQLPPDIRRALLLQAQLKRSVQRLTRQRKKKRER